MEAQEKPKFYHDIKLLLTDKWEHFPEDFDPENPYEVSRWQKFSRTSFVGTVERLNGFSVVALEDFNPNYLEVEAPEDVELRDGASYIIVRLGKPVLDQQVGC